MRSATDIVAPGDAQVLRSMREKIRQIVDAEPISRRRVIALIEAREKCYHVKVDAWLHRSTAEARQAERDHMVAALSVEAALDRYVDDRIENAFRLTQEAGKK